MEPVARAAVILAVSAAGLGACHQGPPVVTPPPEIVRAALEDLGEGGRPAAAPLPGMFHRVDITPDGEPDWVVDFSEDQTWCGSGGCRQVIYVSQPDGAHGAVFDQQTREWALTRSGSVAMLDVEVYGGWCGQAGVAECRLRFVWDEAEGRFTEAPNGAGVTRLRGPLYQPLEDASHLLGRGAVQTACAGKARPGPDLKANTVPDLDGDGVRDVVLHGDADPQATVLVSSAGFAPVMALAGAEYEIDIATRPARLWALAPGAGWDKGLVAYGWNRAACRFEASVP